MKMRKQREGNEQPLSLYCSNMPWKKKVPCTLGKEQKLNVITPFGDDKMFKRPIPYPRNSVTI
jgi:hypothetical protein